MEMLLLLPSPPSFLPLFQHHNVVKKVTKTMDSQPKETTEWVMLTIGGLASGGAVLSGFLWNFILSIRKELLTYVRGVKEFSRRDTEQIKVDMKKSDEKCATHMLDTERRMGLFALKSDVDALREHIDKTSQEQTRQVNQRFDQLTTIIINKGL